MRLQVNIRGIRPRTLRLRRSPRSLMGHWYHLHFWFYRPNYGANNYVFNV